MPTLISVSVLGNTGLPATTTGHIPSAILGIAIDAAGHIYTVNDWDEPHFDLAIYDPATGYITGNSQHPIPESNVDNIALDTSYAYVSGYWYGAGSPGVPYPLVIYRVNLSTYAVDNFTTAGRRIQVNTLSGNDYFIPIALFGSTIYASDPVGNRILAYDKVTGSQTSTWAVTSPGPIATDSSGNIWIASGGTSIQVYSSAGTLLTTPVTGLSYVSAISVLGTKLAVADSNAVPTPLFGVAGTTSRILTYNLSGTSATLSTNFGQLIPVGSTVPTDFGYINAVALTNDGHVIVADLIAVTANTGARLQKFDLSGAASWTQYAMLFASAGYYSPSNPNVLITTEEQTFSINHATQGTTWTGCGNTDQGYFGAAAQGRVSGPGKVVNLGGNDFFYRCTQYGVAVYRVVAQSGGKGPALQFASCISNSRPCSDGVVRAPNTNLWSWHCTTGPGLTSLSSTATSLPGTGLTVDQASSGTWYWNVNSFSIDEAGTIWIAGSIRNMGDGNDDARIWKIPVNSLDAEGNPIYHWADAVPVITKAYLISVMGVSSPTEMYAAYSATDNLIYVGFNNSDGPPVGNQGLGSNVLAAFTPIGAFVWKVIRPNIGTGMTTIPGGSGGLIAGAGIYSDIYNGGRFDIYSKTGALLGTQSPPASLGNTGINLPTGLLDMLGAVSAVRSPDGTLDIFAEDDFNGRVVWYRFSDPAPSYPVLFYITCVQSGISSLGLPVWTVTAPWGFSTGGTVMAALQNLVRKAGNQYGGRMQAYLVSGITNNTEV